MAQRINYTGRKKITKEDVPIRIISNGNGLTFNVELSKLVEYKLDPQARVYVEAYRSASTAWDRWDFGRVGLISPPPIEQRSLDKFGGADGLLFRVKISADGEALGKLLAEADAIRPVLPDDMEGHGDPLIDCIPADIGSEVWRVRFADHMPMLLISDKFGDFGWKELYRDARFRSLVAPAAMRQILVRILVIDRNLGDEENLSDWRRRWIRFAEMLPGVTPDPDTVEDDQSNADDVERWIDSAVSAFSARSGLFDRFMEIRKQEVGQ